MRLHRREANRVERKAVQWNPGQHVRMDRSIQPRTSTQFVRDLRITSFTYRSLSCVLSQQNSPWGKGLRERFRPWHA